MSRVIRRAVCENATVKSWDLANGRISVCVHMCVRVSGWDVIRRIREVCGRRNLDMAPSMDVRACARSTPGLFMVVHVWDAVWRHMEGSCTCRDGVTQKSGPALWVGRITGHC